MPWPDVQLKQRLETCSTLACLNSSESDAPYSSTHNYSLTMGRNGGGYTPGGVSAYLWRFRFRFLVREYLVCCIDMNEWVIRKWPRGWRRDLGYIIMVVHNSPWRANVLRRVYGSLEGLCKITSAYTRTPKGIQITERSKLSTVSLDT